MQSESSSRPRDASTTSRRGGAEALTPILEYRPAGVTELTPVLTPLASDEGPSAKRGVRRVIAGASALACAGALIVGTVLPASNAMTSAALSEAGASQLMNTGSTAAAPGSGFSEPLPLVQTAPQAVASASAAATLAGLEETKLRYPFDSKVPLTDSFGYRLAPVAEFHDAQDLAPDAGTPIRIIGDGVVSEAGFGSDGCGFGLKIEHRVSDQAVTSRYCHMEADSHAYQVGDVVSIGDTAGRVGSTGNSFGAHLHLVVQLEGESIDPLPFIELHSE